MWRRPFSTGAWIDRVGRGKTTGRMKEKKEEYLIPHEVIMNKIYLIRGQKVMLDSEIAELYQVETKRLKEQVKRNKSRFQEAYMFELTENEVKILRSQFATSRSAQSVDNYRA